MENNIVLPHLNIEWNLENSHKDSFSILADGFKPEPIIRENELFKIAVVGCPILDDKICPEKIANFILENEVTNEFLHKLNGQFLIFKLDKQNSKMTVANDRFTAIPLFYAFVNNKFYASLLYFDLFSKLRSLNGFKLSTETMFEFLWLQKVQYDRTYDNFSKFLLPASKLEITKGGINISKFFKPSFEKIKHNSISKAGNDFVNILTSSVKRLTSDSDKKTYGHFLSGGHDSRLAFAAFPEDKLPVCFTVGFSDNYEVQCARKVAEAKKAQHKYIELPLDHFIKHQDAMIKLCGGLYTTDNALFMGITEQVAPFADVIFHGHGFDYLFQGMYLPNQTKYILGRPTFIKKYVPLEGDMVDYFLKNISFRTNIDLLNFVKPEYKQNMWDSLYHGTAQILKDGNDFCQTKADEFEHLLTHAPARHYSNPNITSKMTCGEQRVPCFDNDVFDFYRSLPPEMRVTAQMTRFGLKKLSPKLGSIASGNYGMPAAASPLYKTAWLIGRKLLRHATGFSGLHTPHAEDRTWPDRDKYIRQYPEYQNMIKEAVFSEELADNLNFMDWDKVRKTTEEWFEKPAGGAKFLIALNSIYRLLKLS